MPQNREIILRATAVSGVMVNFLNLLTEEDDQLCPKVIGIPTAELSLCIHAVSEGEEGEILRIWREFGRGYHHSQINFFEPEIRLTCDPLAPLGPDD